MLYPPRRAALHCVQIQTISSSVPQVQITLQKTSIDDVESCFFMETSVAAFRIPTYSRSGNLSWWFDRLSVYLPGGRPYKVCIGVQTEWQRLLVSPLMSEYLTVTHRHS
jgi:hypothetical protein